MIKTTVFISAVIISSTAIGKTKVPIEQCAQWNEKVMEHKEGINKGNYKKWHKEQKEKFKNLMMDANCPARHNEYFK